MSRLSQQELKIQMLADAVEAQRPRFAVASQPLLHQARKSMLALGLTLSAIELSRGMTAIIGTFRRHPSRSERRERLFRAALEVPGVVRCLQRNIPRRRC